MSQRRTAARRSQPAPALPMTALALLMGLLLSVVPLSPLTASSAAKTALHAEANQLGDDLDAYWDAFDWAELDEDAQLLWGVLGWNEYSWEEQVEAPPSEFKAWAQLSAAEQEAAEALDYTFDLWDATPPRAPEGDAEAFWNDQEWERLYPSERALWADLGWDAASWAEESAPPPSDYKDWARLTDDEVAAAEALGYSQESWDAAGPQIEDDPDAYWDAFEWDELLSQEQAHWSILGWSAQVWDQEIAAAYPVSELAAWADLIAEEQAAAAALGYDAESWDASQPRTFEGSPNDFWNDLDVGWDDLYESEQHLWSVLGWSADSWDLAALPASFPASEGAAWADLNADELAAASRLGYVEETWNESLPRGSEGDPNDLWTWSDITWDELKFSEQRLWGILGWNAANWSGDAPATIPATETTPWAELRPVEQAAAQRLGYNEEYWNAVMPRQPDDLDSLWGNPEMAWEELLFSEMRLWGLLGWNAGNWDLAPPASIPASEGTAWADLTPVERAAAVQLGYDEAVWDESLPRSPDGADAEEFWNGLDWGDLRFSEMRLWGILGWHESSWDEESDAPLSEQKTWAQLSAREQVAASSLGYDQETWDAAE